MSWSFAIINGKLGEIYFDKTKTGRIKFSGHCFVDRKDFKTKQEQKAIEEDTRKTKIVYRDKKI